MIDFDDIWQKYSKDSSIELYASDFKEDMLVIITCYYLSNCIPKITCVMFLLLTGSVTRNFRHFR